MPRNAESIQKVEKFIARLKCDGYVVEEIKRSPQIFRINGHRVNVRCKTKTRITSHGDEVFFYDVTLSVLPSVEWVAYIMRSPETFFLLPSSLLAQHVDSMYPSSNNPGVGVFTVNWDKARLELRDRHVPVGPYKHNLHNGSRLF